MKNITYRSLFVAAILRAHAFMEACMLAICIIYALCAIVAAFYTLDQLVVRDATKPLIVFLTSGWKAIEMGTLFTFLLYIGFEINNMAKWLVQWARENRNK